MPNRFLISYPQSPSRPQVPAKKYTTKTGKERTIVKFVPEGGWVANKHIVKILLQEKCAKEKKLQKARKKKTKQDKTKQKKRKERKKEKKNMHAKFERKIIYASCSPLRFCGYLMTLPHWQSNFYNPPFIL